MELYWQNTENKTLESEVWVSAYGLEGLYEVSNFGRIKSLGRISNYSDGRIRKFPEKILRQCKTKHGQTFSLYVRLSLGEDVYKNYTVASLVLNSFNNPVKFSNSTHHINFISYDNRLQNLCFENLSIKRKIEYKKGVRCGEETTNHWKVHGVMQKNINNFENVVILKGKNKNTRAPFQQITRKYPITIFSLSTKDCRSYSSIKNASLLTDLKEYTIRNAIKNGKSKSNIIVKKGILTSKDFLKLKL